MSKNKNRKFLIKVQIVKIVLYPVIVFFDKLGLLKYLLPPVEWSVRLLGMQKSVNAFVQYRDYCSIFRQAFSVVGESQSDVIVFPAFFGANSNFTMFIMMLARYYLSKGYHPLLFVCNSSVPVCQKENIIRSRRFNMFFCHECWNGYKKIASETGIEVQYINEIKTLSISSTIAATHNEIDRLLTIDECRNYIFNGIPVGELALKSLLRFELRGSLEVDSPVLETYKKYLKSTVIVGLTFEWMIDNRKDIRRVVIHNGTLGFEAMIGHICHSRGIPFMTYETYLGENTLVYKKNAEVMLLDWKEEMKAYYEKNDGVLEIEAGVKDFFSELRLGKHKYAVLNKADIPKIRYAQGRYVCAFTNLNFDTTVIGRHTIFTDMEDWLNSLINFWSKNESGVKLVIRIHPAEVKMRTGTREFMGERLKAKIRTDNIILIDSDEQANAYDLIEAMDYGLIYSSTIGMEIAYYGKACVIAGKPFYRSQPFVITPATATEYFEILTQINEGKRTFIPNRESLLRMVHYVFKVRLKELKGIKLFTLNAEKNTDFTGYEEMISENIKFLNDFEMEFSGKEAGI